MRSHLHNIFTTHVLEIFPSINETIVVQTNKNALKHNLENINESSKLKDLKNKIITKRKH